jgi:hypothetical protein
MIRLPLSSVETMTLELMWNFENLIEDVLEILDELAKIKRLYGIQESPPFDPLKTIGKHQ